MVRREALLFVILVAVNCGDLVVAFANGASFSEFCVNPRNTRQVFAVFDTASARGEYLLESKDGGRTWARVLGPNRRVVRRKGAEDFGDFMVADTPAGPMIISGESEGLWQAGPDLRWTRLSFPGGGVEQLIRTADPLAFRVVAEAGGGYFIFSTRNGGGSWTKSRTRLPFSCFQGCDIRVSDSGMTLVGGVEGGSGRGYVSEDGGQTWKRIPPGTPAESYLAAPSSTVKRWPVNGTPAQIKAAWDALKRAATAP